MSISYELMARLLRQRDLKIKSLIAENEALSKELNRIHSNESSMTLQEATELATKIFKDFWATNFESTFLETISVLDKEYESILCSSSVRELIRQSMIYALYHQKNYEIKQ